MRIAVLGGTGTLGSCVVDVLRLRDHDVRVLSRHSPDYRVDLRTGAGLDAALRGCDVAIDASNDSSKAARETLVIGTKRLLDAEVRASVKHHVCVSIVGCERIPARYFRVKAAQAKAVEGGAVPWTIVEATPFHELLSTVLEYMPRFGILPLPRAALQPVAAHDVAQAIASVAEQGPQRRRIHVAGPERDQLSTLARRWARSKGRRLFVFGVPLPGQLGRALRGGALTIDRPEIVGSESFASFLSAEAPLQDLM